VLLKKLLIILLALAALAAGLLLLTRRSVRTPTSTPAEEGCARESTGTTEEGPKSSLLLHRTAAALSGRSGRQIPDLCARESTGTTGEDSAADDPAPDPAEQCVETFDALTDAWEAPAKKGVTMKDVDGFVAAFRRIPADRRDECVHRALNLIPDENVMLLAGILMDKSMDNETRETVFADILNRDEAVKTPILREVQKDKSHPCWKDANWLLD